MNNTNDEKVITFRKNHKSGKIKNEVITKKVGDKLKIISDISFHENGEVEYFYDTNKHFEFWFDENGNTIKEKEVYKTEDRFLICDVDTYPVIPGNSFILQQADIEMNRKNLW